MAQYEAFLQKLESGEPLSSPAQGQPADELQQALVAFVNAEDWDASRQVLEAQQELLLSTRSDERLAMQIEGFKAQDNQELAGVRQKHKDLLLRCRKIGIPEAFAELGPP